MPKTQVNFKRCPVCDHVSILTPSIDEWNCRYCQLQIVLEYAINRMGSARRQMLIWSCKRRLKKWWKKVELRNRVAELNEMVRKIWMRAIINKILEHKIDINSDCHNCMMGRRVLECPDCPIRIVK